MRVYTCDQIRVITMIEYDRSRSEYGVIAVAVWWILITVWFAYDGATMALAVSGILGWIGVLFSISNNPLIYKRGYRDGYHEACEDWK